MDEKTLHIAAGALLGGVISTAITAARDYWDDKKFSSGWKEYAGSFAEGAIAGGVGAATGGASIFATKVAGAGAGFAGNITKQLITKGKVNWKEAAISTAIDTGIAVAGNYAGKIVKNSKVGKYLASKAADLAEKAKKQVVDLVLKGKAFNQAWKESKPNTVTLGSGFGALQSGIDRTKIAMKKVAEGVGEAEKIGGAYKNVPANGGQIHHMPADSISPYPKGKGPGIRMETRDHMDTESWGSSKKAKQYRQNQKGLIEQGKFEEAQQIDINDVRTKFGDKYDDAIEQMLDYTKEFLSKIKK